MAPMSDAEWDRWRNAIHTLYVVEKKPLEGKHGVMGIMKEKHNFSASKAQYERRLGKWGFTKKTIKESWQIGSHKIEKRKKEGKDTLVYRDGVLVPPDKVAKEIGRQGRMTTLESLQMANGPSPRTPPGFDFRTPSENSVVRLELEGLPVLQYMRTILGLTDLTLEPSPSSTECDQIVQITPTDSRREAVGDSALVGLDLPLSTLEDRTAQVSPLQQACGMAFAVSNNLTERTGESGIYQWLERLKLPATASLTMFRGPTGEAILEKAFRMAVEMGHLRLVEKLLAVGADPNMTLCSAPNCPVMLTPLQYACLVGNTPLVQVLCDAGALVNDNPFGWQGSILVLAILRYQLLSTQYLHKNHHSCFGNYECHEGCYRLNPSPDIVRSTIAKLVDVLLSFDAAVNDPGRWATECLVRTVSSPECCLEHLLTVEAHSPLTIAAAYSLTELVEVFLRAGADVHYRVNGVSPALEQSIYAVSKHWDLIWQRPNTHWPPNALHPRDADLVATVKALIRGGASPERRDAPARDPGNEHMAYSLLDHALRCGYGVGGELAEILISNGATLTVHTLRQALICRDFHIFRLVVGLLGSPSEKTKTLLQGRCLGVFGLTYRKDTFSDRDMYQTLVLGGLLIAPEADLDDLLLSNPFPDLLSNCRIPDMGPDMMYDEARHFNAKLELLRRVEYLGASPEIFEVIRHNLVEGGQKVTREPLSPRNSPYPRIDAASREDDSARGGPMLPTSPAAYGTPRALTATLNASRSPDCCCSSLPRAIADRDWSLVTQLRAAGAPLNPKCGPGHLANLTLLIETGAPLEMVRWFLQDGVDPDGAGGLLPNLRYAPLPYTIYRCYGRYREALILLLLQHCANPAIVTSRSRVMFRDTALTPVTIAIKSDDLRVVEMLLDHGASPGRHSHPEVLYSPLQLAAYLDREELVELFLGRGADPNELRAETFSRQEPIYYYRRDYIGSPIQSAVVAGNLKMVDMLLRNNSHPDLSTPLTPHTPLQIACRKKLDAIARLLIEYGANINAPPAERHGATALQFAAINCRLELAQMLVQKGADVNAPPAAYEGRTALEGAAEHGRIDMVQYLVNVGADISGDQYERALERSRSNGHFTTWNLLVSYL